MKRDPRYTSETVFDFFPWPQSPKQKDAREVSRAAVALCEVRAKILAEDNLCLREIYRLLELEGDNPLKEAHEDLDEAVRHAYGISPNQDVLAFLLALNKELAVREAESKSVVGPGLPCTVEDPDQLVTDYCIRPPRL